MSFKNASRLLERWSLAACLLVSLACSNDGKLSARRAGDHVVHLSQIVEKDVAEIRSGLPEGAKQVAAGFSGGDPTKDPELAKQTLASARNRVQDLRIAKSSFFALVSPDGTVVRNDRDVDMMAGKDLFKAFPTVKGALDGTYVETTGSMHEARDVEGKPDGQWVAATNVRAGSDVVALYVTGWAWSSYARRLEEALRSKILDEEKGSGEPLYYVYLVDGDDVFGSRKAPEVNAQAIRKLDPGRLCPDDAPVTRELEITGRAFGLGLKRLRVLGPEVLVAVVRSET